MPNETKQSPRPKTTPRPRLTRDLVMKKALEVADHEGIDALTMRRLAQELGVEAMSLYHHVANKDQLLDGLIDLVFAEIELPSRQEHWKTALRSRSISAYKALVRHPWSVGLMESRTAPGPATLRHHETVLACLRNGGFSLAATAHAYSLLDSYIYGFALQEINLPFNTSDEAAPVADSMMTQMPMSEFPYMIEMAMEHVLKPGYAYSDEYAIGLEIILDGLEKLRDTNK